MRLGPITVSDMTTDLPEPSNDQTPELQHLERALATAERKLAEARLQIAELEALLEEIPEIFERKFEQRLQPVLERQERLQSDNTELRQQIQLLAPMPGEVRLRFNPETVGPAHGGINLPQLPSRSSMRRAGRAERRNPRAA